MSKCKSCGKSGLFLFINSRGLCKDCAEKNKNLTSQIKIHIGLDDINTPKIGVEKLGHEDEERACEYFIDELVKKGRNRDKFKIEHRAQEYTSLVYGLSDFIRIKITDNTKWISIFVSDEDKKKYENSPLFVKQIDKAAFHWKSYFESFDDLSKYIDLAFNAPVVEVYGTDRPLTEKENEVAEYLVNLFKECGANKDDFFLYILSNEYELIYHSQLGRVRVKVYGKKKGGYISDAKFSEYGIEVEKDRFSFIELSELDILKERFIPGVINRALVVDKYNSDMQYYKKYM